MVHSDCGNLDSREKTPAISNFTGNKKGQSQVTKKPLLTTLMN